MIIAKCGISVYLLCYFCSIVVVHCQRCPTGWVDYQQSCYKFARSPSKTVIQAEQNCLEYNAHLVSVNSLREHLFITSWLRRNDPLVSISLRLDFEFNSLVLRSIENGIQVDAITAVMRGDGMEIAVSLLT